MKLLFYIDSIGFGGAERVISNLANQLQLKGHQSIVVTSFRSTSEYVLDEGVERISLNDTYISNFVKRNLLLSFRLRKVLKRIRPDVGIVFLPQPIFRMAVASIGLNTKLLFSVRNDPKREYGSFLYKCLAKICFKKADGIVFQTKDAQRFFSRDIRNKSVIIFNQVDEKFYQRSQYSPKKSGIVATGRLASQKNHKILIDAYNLIKDQITEDLVIYGEGPLRDELTTYIDDLKLNERVSLSGTIKDVEVKLPHYKVYVLSSDYEGLPNGLMEAMAMGMPCVSTDCPCGGPRSLFGTLQSQFLVPVSDSMALSKALLEIVSSDDLMHNLSMENIERARQFSPSVIINKWESHIMSLLNEK